MYSYGHPDNPKPTDQRFDTPEEAERAALKHQDECPFDGLLVVRDDDGGLILKVILYGLTYSLD